MEPPKSESPRANGKMAERSFDSFVGQDIEFSYKMGLEGLHGYYFTFSYAVRYISRSFDQFCFLYFCSGFSLEDFYIVTELSRFNLKVAFLKV